MMLLEKLDALSTLKDRPSVFIGHECGYHFMIKNLKLDQFSHTRRM